MSFLISIVQVVGLDAALMRKALVLALAAWLSFVIAAVLHVHNAYWAAMPVWVLTQPSRGLVLERGLFRMLGTLIGAAVGFALVNVPLSPYWQLILLALWIGLNAGLVHVMRGVSSYGALLAGMTAAIVLIPSLLAPAESMSIAVARVECTLIGVAVGGLVLALLTPQSSFSAFYSQIRTVSAEAVTYTVHVLQGDVPDPREEQRILRLISQLEATARTHAAGSIEGYRRLDGLELLVVGAMSTMAAAQALRVSGVQCPQAYLARLQQCAAHLQTAWDQPFAMDLWHQPEFAQLEDALAQILEADRILSQPICNPAPKQPLASLAPHREWVLAWQMVVMGGVASFLATAAAYSLRWPPAELAALGVCIFVLVLGAMPLPQSIAPKLLTGVAVGVVVGILYRVAVQPALGSTTGLVLTILPFFLVGGWVRVHPRIGPASVDMNMCFLLVSQAGGPATHDLGGLLVNSLALVGAASLMTCVFILWPRRIQKQAEDAATTIQRDLQRILESDENPDSGDWRARNARQILRLTLHLSRAGDLGKRGPKGLLASLNLGQILIDWRQVGIPLAVKNTLLLLLQQHISPSQAADRLLSLAEGPESAEQQRIRQLAATLRCAADVLMFGMPRGGLHPQPD